MVIKLRSLAIAPSNSDILYTADQTNMWKTTDGGTTNWTSITLPSQYQTTLLILLLKIMILVLFGLQ